MFWTLCRAFPGQFDRHSFGRERVAVVLAAQRQLRELQRQELELAELQGAQLCSLLYNINRDRNKGKASTYRDWQFFGRGAERDEADQLPAVVAHVCLALRHEQRLPSLLLGIWLEVLRRAKEPAATTEIRALISTDQQVVIVAPCWEGQHLRGFLAVKGTAPNAVVQVHDIDRPLMRYALQMPSRLAPVHYEAGVLLLSAHTGSRLLEASSL